MDIWKDVMIVVIVIGGVSTVIITVITVKCCRVKDETLLTEHIAKALSCSSCESVNSPLSGQVQTKY